MCRICQTAVHIHKWGKFVSSIAVRMWYCANGHNAPREEGLNGFTRLFTDFLIWILFAQWWYSGVCDLAQVEAGLHQFSENVRRV